MNILTDYCSIAILGNTSHITFLKQARDLAWLGPRIAHDAQAVPGEI